jgi:hypothetical protein
MWFNGEELRYHVWLFMDFLKYEDRKLLSMHISWLHQNISFHVFMMAIILSWNQSFFYSLASEQV